MYFAKIQPTNIRKQYKKMSKLSEKNQLEEMQNFLSEKKLITILAQKSDVSTRTVYDTFANSSPDDLKGKQLTVYRNAIELINEIKSLPRLAAEALEK